MKQIIKYLSKLTVNYNYLENVLIKTGFASLSPNLDYDKHRKLPIIPYPFHQDPKHLRDSYETVLKEYLFVFIHNAITCPEHDIDIKLFIATRALNKKVKTNISLKWLSIMYNAGSHYKAISLEEIIQYEDDLTPIGSQHVMVTEILNVMYADIILWFLDNKDSTITWYEHQASVVLEPALN
jgi:hypothetical protein